MTHTFLLEIGLEEMPDNAILSAEKQLVEKTKEFLNDHHLSHGDVQGFSTPRRFSVMVEKLADRQADETLIVRGPSKEIAQDDQGNWTKAAIGFSKGQGGSVEDLIIKEDKGKPYIFMEKFIPGKESKEILKGMTEVIKNIEFPKLMKWGNKSYHYARPIHWIVSLLDLEVIPMEIFDIKSSNVTSGHRFLGDKIEINHPREYEEKLKEEYVIANRTERQKMIVEQITEIAEEKNWMIPNLHSDLLEEVTDLVEYPTAFYGSFEESYLEIPNIVLETSMIDHQRYFSVWSSNESELLAHFISVRNGNEKYIETVAKGNEKVLSARLADAKFFYDEDKKLSIQDSIEKLKLLDYHEDIGTVYEKQRRVNKMIKGMNQYIELSKEEKRDLERISAIYKFDLVTQIVGEFPSLQGEIGALYAEERGENKEVSEAIGEQYLPSSAHGKLPETKLAKLLALVDKTDSLIQFFAADLIPTGSNDPYALRRQAMGIVRIILALEIEEFNLNDFLEEMIQSTKLSERRQKVLEKNKTALIDFILRRVEQIMENEYKIPHDIRQATLGIKSKNIMQIIENAEVLKNEKTKEGFKEFIESITRVLNITKKDEKTGEYSEELIETTSERELVRAVDNLTKELSEITLAEEQYNALKQLETKINDFFEENMIMVDNKELKENRLIILQNVSDIVERYADFNQIIV